MSLYGTRDAADNFQKEVTRLMLKLGLVQSKYNASLYMRKESDGVGGASGPSEPKEGGKETGSQRRKTGEASGRPGNSWKTNAERSRYWYMEMILSLRAEDQMSWNSNRHCGKDSQ